LVLQRCLWQALLVKKFLGNKIPWKQLSSETIFLKKIPWGAVPWNDIPWENISLLCRITQAYGEITSVPDYHSIEVRFDP
jgi:hypothetical protein